MHGSPENLGQTTAPSLPLLTPTWQRQARGASAHTLVDMAAVEEEGGGFTQQLPPTALLRPFQQQQQMPPPPPPPSPLLPHAQFPKPHSWFLDTMADAASSPAPLSPSSSTVVSAASSAASLPSTSLGWSEDERRVLLQVEEEAHMALSAYAAVADTATTGGRVSGNRRRGGGGGMAPALSHDTVTLEMDADTDAEGVGGVPRRDNSVDGETQSDESGEVESTPEMLRHSYARVRLALSQNRNAQTMAYTLYSVMPFFLLFLVKLCYERRTGLMVALFGYVLFIFGDKNVTSILSHGKGSIPIVFLATILYHSCLYYLFAVDLEELAAGLAFQPTQFEDFFTTLFYVVTADLVIKHFTVLVKGALALMPERTLSLKRRRRLLQCVEYASQTYRASVATPRWIMYLLGPATLLPSSSAIVISQDGRNAIATIDTVTPWAQTPTIDLILTVLYLLCKLKELLEYGRLLSRSFTSMMRLVSYGVVPTAAEIEQDPKCAICYDTMRTPIKLVCNHLFCETCVEKWLDEKHTCPMCRATVDEQDASWINGATAKTLRLY